MFSKSVNNTFELLNSYIILFVALTMLVKPLWPVVEYIVNYDYISNVLCENKDKPELKCDGKCYLAQMLAEESGQNEKNPFGEKKIIETYQFLQTEASFNLNSINLLVCDQKTKIGFLQNLKSFLFIFKMIQPPELS